MRKFSTMTTDEALDTFCEITPFVSNIVSDQDLMESIGKGVEKKGMTSIGVIMLGIKRLLNAAPILLKNHRQDIYNIVAVMHEEDKTVDDIAKQGFITTFKQIRALSEDKELMDFFKSWAHGEETE